MHSMPSVTSAGSDRTSGTKMEHVVKSAGSESTSSGDASSDKGHHPRSASPTPHIGKISVLGKMSSRDQALEILHELATSVAPILEHYSFSVNLLREFYPENQNLLGMNKNFGDTIYIRLRTANNENWFLPNEEIVETMLHELVHNRFQEHNEDFYSLLDELRNMYLECVIQGFEKQEQKLSDISVGMILGGAKVTSPESIREARLKKLAQVKENHSVKENPNKQVLISESSRIRAAKLREKMAIAAEKRSSGNCADFDRKQKETNGKIQIIEILSGDDEQMSSDHRSHHRSNQEIIEID
ncbi:unnamed protein product [Ambrosiozyma monospora]|uniref:Unnamed protein product n=1 Tax=Ambrosiozyma monospora TaxID=43982 RepID=A0A9W6Z5Z1_AMBMO|nr:unnamed protein product [Ambrosiozyma monospora]